MVTCIVTLDVLYILKFRDCNNSAMSSDFLWVQTYSFQQRGKDDWCPLKLNFLFRGIDISLWTLFVSRRKELCVWDLEVL